MPPPTFTPAGAPRSRSTTPHELSPQVNGRDAHGQRHHSGADHFGMDEDDGHAFVIKQPTGDAEVELCVEAMEGCPVEAIGDDGEGDAE